MKIIHCWKKNIIEKEVGNEAKFLLSDQQGGYLALLNNQTSRYNGWFVFLDKKHFKIIEDIRPIDKELDTLKNNFWGVERQGNGVSDLFFLPPLYHSLVYETFQDFSIELTLDFKEAYQNEATAQYEIFNEGKFIIIKCLQVDEVSVFLAVYGQSKNYLKIGEYFDKHYPFDQERNSPPFQRRVYKAIQLKGRKVVFSSNYNKEAAKKEARSVYKSSQRLRKKSSQIIDGYFKAGCLKNASPEITMAYLCAKNSLAGLLADFGKKTELYAGWPWFFQFWTRDAAIALKALLRINSTKAKKIFFELFNRINPKGAVPRIITEDGSAMKQCADGTGWILKRADDLFGNRKFNWFWNKEVSLIKKCLALTVKSLVKSQSKNGLAINNAGETWMDTQDRSGSAIEIQTLRLAIYQAAYNFTGDNYYLRLVDNLRKRVQRIFWQNGLLSDNLNESVIRPNIFLAAYLAPDLLSDDKWLICLENSLSHLWLDWGGLATIDTQSFNFIREHTGENPASYHNGDSWFFLNNLAALTLHRINQERFSSYIEKILAASTQEILWQGAIGHHSELSSAASLKSQGAWAQAWSNAMYIEMIDEFFRK